MSVTQSTVPTSCNSESLIKRINKYQLFDIKKVSTVVDEYLKMEFEQSYFNFEEEKISEHIHGYLCASAKSEIVKQFEYSAFLDTYGFVFCGSSSQEQIEALNQIDEYITSKQDMIKTHAISVNSFRSATKDVMLFTVEINPFRSSNKQTETPVSGPTLESISTEKFVNCASDELKNRHEVLLKQMHQSFNSAVYTVNELPEKKSEVQLTIAFRTDRPSYFSVLNAILKELPNSKINQESMESFANGIQVYSYQIYGVVAAELEAKVGTICQLPYRPNSSTIRLMYDGALTAEETVYSNCLVVFAFYFSPPAESRDYNRLHDLVEKDEINLYRLNSLRNGLTQEIRSESHLREVIAEDLQLIKKMYRDFKAGSTVESREELLEEINNTYGNDFQTKTIMVSFLTFNASVVKHNFFNKNKSALAFRLDAEPFFDALGYQQKPNGIFLFIGSHWRGFHIRVTDIARGGVRMVLSDSKRYKTNKATLFEENYNLAYTQLLKNKDIPEGGSKGTILVSTRIASSMSEKVKRDIFCQYVDALLDVILPEQPGVVDQLKRQEIIFLGPDENTAGNYPYIGALHAKERGYQYWKCFTTGKEPSLGGIPHDLYGMTTRSIRQYVKGIYDKLGLEENKMTKFQTGGPDGDLGSNEILLSEETLIALSDSAGVLCDPVGINKEELKRLAKNRQPSCFFDRTKLSSKGFMVKADKNWDETTKAPILLPDGTKVWKSVEFRDNFQFSEYAKAEVFVPCGGRPKTVNIDNVHRLINNHSNITGEMMFRGQASEVKPEDLQFKIIVEGANLFLTGDARIALENCGVVVIKDASANKGGVTSSSMEVYAGLALTDEEYKLMMCSDSNGKLPEFYKSLVEDIKETIERNARREFELIWDTSLQTGMKRTAISDALSRKIVQIRTYISVSKMFEDKPFVRYILQQYTPPTILKQVPVDEIMRRVPEEYQRAICAIWLASNYVYTRGIESTEFDFYEFMNMHRSKAETISAAQK